VLQRTSSVKCPHLQPGGEAVGQQVWKDTWAAGTARSPFFSTTPPNLPSALRSAVLRAADPPERGFAGNGEAAGKNT
jgi:hypothetical protein